MLPLLQIIVVKLFVSTQNLERIMQPNFFLALTSVVVNTSNGMLINWALEIVKVFKRHKLEIHKENT